MQTKDDRYSLKEILANHSSLFSNSPQINAIWRKKKQDPEEKVLLLTHNKITFNNKDCSILTINDLTKSRKSEMLETRNNMLNLLTANVSHEMTTPLSCIISFSEMIIVDSNDEEVCKIA